MTKEEALVKRRELLDTIEAGIKYAQALTTEHKLTSFDLTIDATSYDTKYTATVNVGDSHVEAWVSSNYTSSDWNSSDC